MKEKEILRKKIIEQRKNKNHFEINQSSKIIFEKIISNDLYKKAQIIMLYSALPGEIILDDLINQALKDNKTVCVPYLHKNFSTMDAAVISDISDLVLGKFNIKMPKIENLKIINPINLDLIFVPGLAYDKNGYRLGFGGGYYDKFLLKSSNANFIGVIYDEYILNEIPIEKHDISMSYLVSESGILRCIKGKM